MDGDDPQATVKDEQGIPEERSFTLKEARATLVFWLIVLTLAIQGVVGTAIPYHIDALAFDNGMSKHEALNIFIPISMIAPIVGFIVGWACDRYPMKYILSLLCFFQIFGFISFAFIGSDLGWALAVAGIGLSAGFFGPLSTIAMPYFFGRKHLGEINGNMMKMMVIGSAIGPLFFSILHDTFGSFHIAFFCGAGLSVVLLSLSLRVKNPRPLAL
ncbi:MAG: MFS transporter [Planctomycetes bacterium]|nr:MFS transporter [Planctomycetota bacterium]